MMLRSVVVRALAIVVAAHTILGGIGSARAADQAGAATDGNCSFRSPDGKEFPGDAKGWYDLGSQRVKDDDLITWANYLRPLCCGAAPRSCCTKLHRIESELRRRLLAHMAKEKKLQAQTVKELRGETPEERLAHAKAVIANVAAETTAIEKILTVLPHRPDPTSADSFYEFERRLLQFYAGLEVAPDKLSEASPLVGFLVQTRFVERHPECRQGVAFYGIHNALRTQIGSARESNLLDADSNRIKNAFEFGIEAFVPLIRSGLLGKSDEPHAAQNYVGPLLEIGGRWSSARANQQIDPRYYAGVRLAFSPENITDFLVGRTESRDGLRAEARAQGRVGTLKENPVLVGAAANVGIQNRDTDSIRVYILWRTKFSDALGGILPK